MLIMSCKSEVKMGGGGGRQFVVIKGGVGQTPPPPKSTTEYGWRFLLYNLNMVGVLLYNHTRTATYLVV